MTAAADEQLRVRADEWRATAERLRAEGFDFLQNLTAVDWIKRSGSSSSITCGRTRGAWGAS